MSRDLTKRQFRDRMEAAGWSDAYSLLGYWSFKTGDGTATGNRASLSMSTWNYPTRRVALAAFKAKGYEIMEDQESKS